MSYFAKLIEIEPIIGAFLTGIAITQLIPQLRPLMNRIQFISNTLFVPFFLISAGMLVNPLILFQEPRSLVVSAVMVGVAIAQFFPLLDSKQSTELPRKLPTISRSFSFKTKSDIQQAVVCGSLAML